MASIRRSVKNAAKNFAACERDVRDATSNDRSLAGAATMARIANATYDVTTSPLVMAMLWKRLNDVGKNWRHVYKGLVLVDYLLKTGAEHVVVEVQQNKFAIQSLQEFVYVDSRGVDKGINVRQHAKVTLDLIEDEEKLRSDRRRCLQEHKRLTDALGRKALPRGVAPSRAKKFAKKANVMPNGEVAPNLAQQELEAIRNAQLQSYQEFATSTAGQMATLEAQMEYDRRNAAQQQQQQQQGNQGDIQDNGPLHATEEEALAYALRISALESGVDHTNPDDTITYNPQSANQTATPPPPQQQTQQPKPQQTASSNDYPMTPEEEEQLAIALSLSLVESQNEARSVVDSDDESDADEDTPPSTPYDGDFYQGIPPHLNELPTYEDSMLETTEIPRDMDASAMENFLRRDSSIGNDNLDQFETASFPESTTGYMEIHPPTSALRKASTGEDDEEL